MSNPRYPEEFKIQAVNQVTEKKLPVADVAARLGVSSYSLYAWIKRYSKPQAERQQDDDQHAELRRLRPASSFTAYRWAAFSRLYSPTRWAELVALALVGSRRYWHWPRSWWCS